jgi:hypothetical protein
MAMIFMIATNHYKENAYQEYRIAIDGYDPRDLLKGHYIRFTYGWPKGTVNPYADNRYPPTEQVCVCFSGDPLNPDVRFDSCKARTRQDSVVTLVFVSVGGAAALVSSLMKLCETTSSPKTMPIRWKKCCVRGNINSRSGLCRSRMVMLF